MTAGEIFPLGPKKTKQVSKFPEMAEVALLLVGITRTRKGFRKLVNGAEVSLDLAPYEAVRRSVSF